MKRNGEIHALREAIYRRTGAKCRIDLAPPESGPWSLRVRFADGRTGFDFHPSRLHDWFKFSPNAAYQPHGGGATPESKSNV